MTSSGDGDRSMVPRTRGRESYAPRTMTAHEPDADPRPASEAELHAELAALVRAFRVYAASDGPEDGFARELAAAGARFEALAALPDPPPAVHGARAAWDDMFKVWLAAEQTGWRSRVALIQTGAHDWHASVEAIAALSPFPTRAYDVRGTHWDALVETAPDRAALARVMERLTPWIERELFTTNLHGTAARRYAQLGDVDAAITAAQKVAPLYPRARTLEKLAPLLDEATLAREADRAWAEATEAATFARHFLLCGYELILAVHPAPHARLVELEAFVSSLPEEDCRLSQDHDDARTIIADGWERAGDRDRATRWRALVPPPEPDPPAEPEPPFDPDDPWDVDEALPATPADALRGVLERAISFAEGPWSVASSAWRRVLVEIAGRPDAAPDVVADARRECLRSWRMEEDIPGWLDRDGQRALLRDALRRKRGRTWAGPVRDRGLPRRQRIEALGGAAALRAWAVMDVLDET